MDIYPIMKNGVRVGGIVSTRTIMVRVENGRIESWPSDAQSIFASVAQAKPCELADLPAAVRAACKQIQATIGAPG